MLLDRQDKVVLKGHGLSRAAGRHMELRLQATTEFPQRLKPALWMTVLRHA